MLIVDDQGNPKTINPICALHCITNPTGATPLDNAF